MKSGKIFFLLITLLLISLYATIVGIFKQKPLLTFVGTLLSGFFAILEIIISIKNNLNIEVELRRQRILNQALIQGIKKGRYENPFFKEAETTMLKGSYRITVSKLEEALKIEPDNVKAHIHLGALYLMKSIIEGQKKLLDKAKNEFMIAGKLSNESELQVIAKQGLGIALSESGENYPEAVRILKEALSLKPDMPLLRSNLGLVYLKMGKMEHAKQYFEEDIKKYPYLPYPYYYLGNYFEEKQQLFAAIAEYEKVLFIDSDHLLSFWRLILCNMKVGRVSEALFLCILFLKNTSKHIKLWKNAKMLFFILSLEWIKLAIRKKVSKICRLVKIPFAGPSIPLIQYATKSILLGNLNEALIAYQESALIDPFFPPIFINMAIVYNQIGDNGKSIEFAKKAVSLCSKYRNKKLMAVAEKYARDRNITLSSRQLEHLSGKR